MATSRKVKRINVYNLSPYLIKEKGIKGAIAGDIVIMINPVDNDNGK